MLWAAQAMSGAARGIMTVLLVVLTTCMGYAMLFNSSFVPQLTGKPPARVALGEKTPVDDLLEAGAGIFEAECAQCHRIGATGRGPDLAGMGARALSRAAEAKLGDDATGEDYLVSSLCDPGLFVVPEFAPIMPKQQNRLEGGQILAIVAFLQSLGGEPTVDGTEVELIGKYCGSGDEGAGGTKGGGATEPLGSPEEMAVKFACSGCHDMTTTDRLVGPGLGDVGSRLTHAQIYEALLDPDRTIAPGYPPGLMTATLAGNGFYDQLGTADIKALVGWLSEKTGEPKGTL